MKDFFPWLKRKIAKVVVLQDRVSSLKTKLDTQLWYTAFVSMYVYVCERERETCLMIKKTNSYVSIYFCHNQISQIQGESFL